MRFVLNGKRTDVPAPPLKRLLDVLREDCGLAGTKEGCGEGECGACTVLLDGAPVNSCLVPLAHVRGRKVTTIEGLRSRVPEALAREGGTQCGICTPGVVMAAAALGPKPNAARVREALAGNLCRCTGYAGIVRALAGPRAAPHPRVRAAGPRSAGSAEGRMATALSRLALLQPRTLAEALRMLRDEGPLVPLAGCTDLYVGLHFGTVREPRFLDLQGLRALRGIRLRGETLVIGALATYSELIASPLVRRRLPILAEASRWVGSPQIQNRGTLGGNVANASPAGDTLPVLAVAEATVLLRSVDGERRVPFGAFYTGYRQTVMRPDELIVAIEVPPVEGRQWFRKVGTRAAQAISKVVMAAVRAPHPRIALGSVAPTVVRVPRTEAVLAGGGTLAEAQAVLMDEIQPIDDLRSTAAYRRRVSANLLAQFWSDTRRRR